jgi:hypothetical protein
MKTAALPLGPEIISGHKIGQDAAPINMSHLSFKISLLGLGLLTRGLPLFVVHTTADLGRVGPGASVSQIEQDRASEGQMKLVGSDDCSTGIVAVLIVPNEATSEFHVPRSASLPGDLDCLRVERWPVMGRHNLYLDQECDNGSSLVG